MARIASSHLSHSSSNLCCSVSSESDGNFGIWNVDGRLDLAVSALTVHSLSRAVYSSLSDSSDELGCIGGQFGEDHLAWRTHPVSLSHCSYALVSVSLDEVE